jgi:hypothetical protein
VVDEVNRQAKSFALTLVTPWPDLPIFYLLPCAHPTCPNRLELSPGCMGWSWNRQNHPERPLWPREIISRRLRDRAPVGALPPSPEQRDKAAPLGKGVKPPRRAGYCRELEATGALSCRGTNPPSRIPASGNLVTCVGPTKYQLWQSFNPLQTRVWP